MKAMGSFANAQDDRMTERKCSEWQFVIEKAAAIFLKIAAAGIWKF